MLIAWESRLDTGVRCFDEEHKTILKMLNFMRELLSQGKREEATKFIVDVLLPYVVSHLRHEEEVFRLFNYEEGERHAKTHESVENLFREFIAPLEEGEDKVIRHFQAVIVGWLYGHIEKVDKKYGDFFTEKGLIDKVNEIDAVKPNTDMFTL